MLKTGLFRSKLQQKFILNQLAHSSFALIAIIKKDNTFELGETIDAKVNGRQVKGIVIGKYNIKSARFIVKWSGFDDVEKWVSFALRDNSDEQNLVIYLIRLSEITDVIAGKRASRTLQSGKEARKKRTNLAPEEG